MWRRAELARLNQELDILDVFDRVHDYGFRDSTHRDNDAYAFRQMRRSEILAEIAKITERKTWLNAFRKSAG